MRMRVIVRVAHLGWWEKKKKKRGEGAPLSSRLWAMWGSAGRTRVGRRAKDPSGLESSSRLRSELPLS